MSSEPRVVRPSSVVRVCITVLLVLLAGADRGLRAQQEASAPSDSPSGAGSATGQQPPADPLEEPLDDLLQEDDASRRRRALDPELVPRREHVASALTLSRGRDSGFLFAGEELDDDVYLVQPSLLLDRRPSARTNFLLAYEPEAQFFDRHPELDSVEHAAGLLVEHTTERRSELSFGGSLLDGEDPGRRLDTVLLLLPRTPYRQWRAWAGFEQRWQRTIALFTLTRTDTRIDPAPGLFGSGIDRTEDTAAVTLTRSLARRLDLLTSYTYSRPTSSSAEGGLQGVLLPAAEPVQTFHLGLVRHLRPTLSLLVSGGAAESDGEVSALAALELVRSGPDFNLRLRYDLSLLSLGLTPASGAAAPSTPPIIDTAFPESTSHVLGLDFELRPARRLRWVQSMRATAAELPGNETLESYSVVSRLVVEALPRLAPFIQGGLLDQSGSALFGDSFSRYHLTVGLVIGLSGPPDATGVRGRSPAFGRVLPSGRVY